MSSSNTSITTLGVESSCDDTAAAIVTRGEDGRYRVLSNVVWTQTDAHQPYGGVVPEIAARSHVEKVDTVIEEAIAAAGVDLSDLDAVAATAGPGLVGGVMVGLTASKALALAHGLPLIPVNHLEGHALSVRLTDAAPFPYLLLLISGGHTQLIAVEGLGVYRRLGTTIDDAAGEAFDKTAKLLGLGQPGGPMVERAAVGGRADRFDLPRPLLKRPGCDFSFSGLKTAVRLALEDIEAPNGQDVADIAASFQAAAARHLADRTARAIDGFDRQDAKRLVVAGGVAANCAIKSALSAVCDARGWALIAPPAKYCTDNGAMIALAGAERVAAGRVPSFDEALAFAPRARWPLAPPPAGAEHGGGKKGPKA
ncbi:MAG: tRNA (adenosine(37)-N6)-threonylcarbamoyltransferase complex transferase subunit TsaD [Pseudomonadota bacterium]